MKKKQILAELKKMLRECPLTDDMMVNRLTSSSYKLYDMLEALVDKLNREEDAKKGIVFDFNNIKQVKGESGYERPTWGDVQSAHEKLVSMTDTNGNKTGLTLTSTGNIRGLDYEVIYDELEKVKANRRKKRKKEMGF